MNSQDFFHGHCKVILISSSDLEKPLQIANFQAVQLCCQFHPIEKAGHNGGCQQHTKDNTW